MIDLDATMLSRIQFAFVVSFHIIFPSFTIGLAAWLAVMEAVALKTGSAVHRRVFEFWLRVFAIAFGMGVVSGIVMAFQFGTNWSGLARQTGSIQGPLLGYETFTAFLLEATFLGVVLFGRQRVSPSFYLLSCILVAVGTLFSSYWILVNNSWMQVPLGHAVVNGRIVPDDWLTILVGPVQRVRWPHMVLACFITTGASIVATACWWLLQGRHRAEALVCLRWSLGLLAVLTPLQFVVGHFAGMVVHDYQPAKFAAIEARFQTQQPASEVLIGWPDEAAGVNRFAVEVPRLGSFIASGTWTSKEVGLDTIPPRDRPPVLVPFFGFRLMVGMGLLLFAVAWAGVALAVRKGALERARWFQWIGFFSFPAGFLAVLAGWFTAEVGRQPWVVYGLLRTSDAVTPSLVTSDVVLSLAVYVLAYAFIYAFGISYLVRLLHAGPREDIAAPVAPSAKRPMALAAAAGAREE